MGLLEIWMHFLNYVQRIYPEGLSDYKTLEWRPVKEINEATKPWSQESPYTCAQRQRIDLVVLLWDSHCILFHIWLCFLGSQPPHSFYFVWGRGKGWFWHPLRFWWQLYSPSRKIHMHTYRQLCSPNQRTWNTSRLSPRFPEKGINCPWL